MMARAKRIYILIVKVNNLFSFFSSRCFLKEIEHMFSVFLSSYRNTRERLGELEKAVETLACGSCSHSISRSPKLPLVFLYKQKSPFGAKICTFREANSFPRAKLEENCELRGTDNVRGQISVHIFEDKWRLLCLLSF